MADMHWYGRQVSASFRPGLLSNCCAQEEGWLGMNPGVWPNRDTTHFLPSCTWGSMIRMHGSIGLVCSYNFTSETAQSSS